MVALKRLAIPLALLFSAWIAYGLIFGDTRDDLTRGAEAYFEGEYDEAYRLLKPLADDGNAKAHYYVAKALLFGEGAPKDVAIGLRWLSKSIKSGNVEALSYLAALYGRGFILTKNEECAFLLFERAAERGDLSAIAATKRRYEKSGKFGESDVWFRRWFQRLGGDDFLINGRLGLEALAGEDKTEAYSFLVYAESFGSQEAGQDLALIRSRNDAVVQRELKAAEDLAKAWRTMEFPPPAELHPVTDECLP